MNPTAKNALIAIIILIIIGAGYWYISARNTNDTPPPAAQTQDQATIPSDNGRIATPAEEPTSTTPPAGKLKVANFSGKLEKVDTGCFADGECYVVVDGKHITTTMGWSRETVGSVQGVAGFGDLEQHIGQEIKVYAQDKGDGIYTLYGSEGFYVRLKEKAQE